MNRQFPKGTGSRGYKHTVHGLQGNVERLDQPIVQGNTPQYQFNFSKQGELSAETLAKKKEKNDIATKLKKYNRRLVLMNIVFLIIALVAIISLLFMPFAKINIKLDHATISSTVDKIHEDRFTQTFKGYLTKSDIQNATKDISVSFGVCDFKTFDFLRLGIDKNLEKTKQALKDHISKNWVKPIGDLVTQATPAVFALSARMAISMVATNVNIDIQQFDSLLNSAQTAMTELQANNVDQATSNIMNAITPILTANNIQQDTQDKVKEQVNQVLTIINTNARPDGAEFSFNAIIGNLDKIISEITALNSGNSTPSTQANANNSISSVLGDLIENIANPDKVVDDLVASLSDSQKQLLSYGIFGFGLLTCISAAIWALLVLAILFSFIRRKKSVSLWAVIWLGGLQSIWMLPLIFLTIFHLTSIIQYISFTWIALAASLLTMLLYFIFYREAKKQSKKLRKMR